MQMRHISFAIAAILASTAVHAAPNTLAASRAQGLIDSHPGWVNRAAGDTFVQRDTVTDADGNEHVRFDRYYNGLPVIGGDVVVHSKDGNLKQTSQGMMTSHRPSLAAKLDAQQALTAAGVNFGPGFVAMPSANKVIYARGATPVLAYEAVYNGVRADQTPTEMHYIVDANSGAILEQWDGVHTANASGTAKTLFSGSVGITTNSTTSYYQLRDYSRGGNWVTNLAHSTSSTANGTTYTDADNIWGNGSTSSGVTVAGDAMYGVSKTWDYYLNIHGRNGIANNGTGAVSRMHYGTNYVNAFWSDSLFGMTYGDGDGVSYYPLVSIDVAGHEMTHGVTSRTAALTYSGESGGLNEATSDIMGTMVEYYANNAYDKPDYLIGEKIFMNNTSGTTALRYMFKPSRDGSSPDCYTSTIGNLDVHYSSGVANHFYYLLAEGAVNPSGFSYSPSQLVCNGNTAAGGIGRAAAQKIWYRALTVYMTSSTKYAGARTATLNAARDLYGSTSTQYNGVASAWSAVSVN